MPSDMVANASTRQVRSVGARPRSRNDADIPRAMRPGPARSRWRWPMVAHVRGMRSWADRGMCLAPATVKCLDPPLQHVN